MLTETIIRNLAVFFHSLMIGAAAATAGQPVSYERVTITIPVFISALIATGVFVWTIAKYDSRRALEIKRLQVKVDALLANQEEYETRRRDAERPGAAGEVPKHNKKGSSS